jgi:hypothetical protein
MKANEQRTKTNKLYYFLHGESYLAMPTRLVVLHDWVGEWCCTIRAGVGELLLPTVFGCWGSWCIAHGVSGLGLWMLTCAVGPHLAWSWQFPRSKESDQDPSSLPRRLLHLNLTQVSRPEKRSLLEEVPYFRRCEVYRVELTWILPGLIMREG